MNTTTLSVGHTATFTIVYLDAIGNPMLVTPTPDSPPVWTNAPVPAGDDTFTVAADSLSSTAVAVAAGTDTISLTVIVGGVTFTATNDVTITGTSSTQVLTSVQIASTVV